MKNLITILTVVCLLILATKLTAQNKNYNEEVTVVASYEPTLSDAFKLNKNPKITDTIIPKSKLNFTFRNKEYTNIFIKPDPIKPAKMQTESLIKLYKHYIRIGMGNYTHPYGEYFFNSTRSKTSTIAFHFKHVSATGKLKDYHYSGNSTDELNFAFRKFTPKYTWKTGVDGSYDILHWYGFKPKDYDTTFAKDQFKQQFLNVGAHASVESNYIDTTKLHHSFGIGLNHFSDKNKTAQNSITFTGLLKKNLNMLDFKKAQTCTLNVGTDLDSYGSTLQGIVQIVPKIKTRLDVFDLTLGLNSSLQIDGGSKLHLYPIADVYVPLAKGMYGLYLGAKGSLDKNSFKNFANENPFIISSIPISFSNNKSEYYFGVKGNVSSRFAFNTSVSYQSIDNLPLFINSHDTTQFADNSNRFTVIYDNADLLKLHAICYYRLAEKFKLMLGGNYYKYNMETQTQPWHRQPYDVTLGVDYNLQNKIIMKADIMYLGESYAQIWDTKTTTKTTTVDGIIDANLLLEYRYSKIWSAFISFNNIAASKYTRWNNYPSYRFQIMGGLTLSIK